MQFLLSMGCMAWMVWELILWQSIFKVLEVKWWHCKHKKMECGHGREVPPNMFPRIVLPNDIYVLSSHIFLDAPPILNSVWWDCCSRLRYPSENYPWKFTWVKTDNSKCLQEWNALWNLNINETIISYFSSIFLRNIWFLFETDHYSEGSISLKVIFLQKMRFLNL